jgi:hypothetical protein
MIHTGSLATVTKARALKGSRHILSRGRCQLTNSCTNTARSTSCRPDRSRYSQLQRGLFNIASLFELTKYFLDGAFLLRFGAANVGESLIVVPGHEPVYSITGMEMPKTSEDLVACSQFESYYLFEYAVTRRTAHLIVWGLKQSEPRCASRRGEVPGCLLPVRRSTRRSP